MLKPALTAVAFLAASSAAQAQSTVYFGVGGNNEGATIETDDMPFAFGFLVSDPTSPLVYGFDFAAEGEMLDSTFGMDAVRQAYSFNFLIGTNIHTDGNLRIDAAGIIGLRESFSDCADSFIGYQCYADVPPETEYDLNFGGLLTATISNVMIGVRATGVSTQALLGFSF